MTDRFAANVHALINATKDCDGTAPEPSDARHIRRLANWIATQRTNPFVDYTLPQLLAIDFADQTLAWLDNPADYARFEKARLDLFQSLQDD